MYLRVSFGIIEQFLVSLNLEFISDYWYLLERNQLKEKLKEAGISTYTVTDAGRTQIPSGSKTVMGVGPGTLN